MLADYGHGAVMAVPAHDQRDLDFALKYDLPVVVVVDTNAPLYDRVSREVQILASERALPINGTYAAREMRNCDSERRDWVTLVPRRGTLYVLLPEAATVLSRRDRKSTRLNSSHSAVSRMPSSA